MQHLYLSPGQYFSRFEKQQNMYISKVKEPIFYIFIGYLIGNGLIMHLVLVNARTNSRIIAFRFFYAFIAIFYIFLVLFSGILLVQVSYQLVDLFTNQTKYLDICIIPSKILT